MTQMPVVPRSHPLNLPFFSLAEVDSSCSCPHPSSSMCAMISFWFSASCGFLKPWKDSRVLIGSAQRCKVAVLHQWKIRVGWKMHHISALQMDDYKVLSIWVLRSSLTSLSSVGPASKQLSNPSLIFLLPCFISTVSHPCFWHHLHSTCFSLCFQRNPSRDTS